MFNPVERNRKLNETLQKWMKVLEENDVVIATIKAKEYREAEETVEEDTRSLYQRYLDSQAAKV